MAVTMTMANMDWFSWSHNWAMEVGKRMGVPMTTSMMSSSVSILPNGGYDSNRYDHL
jgi:hypothetical protein